MSQKMIKISTWSFLQEDLLIHIMTIITLQTLDKKNDKLIMLALRGESKGVLSAIEETSS